MASKVIDLETRGAVVVIHVRHLDTDSYSRSVARAARQAWNALPHDTRMATRYRVSEYGHSVDGEGACLSTVAFGPSHEAARAALAPEVAKGHAYWSAKRDYWKRAYA